jgi:hypothetical protein
MLQFEKSEELLKIDIADHRVRYSKRQKRSCRSFAKTYCEKDKMSL